MLTILLKKQRKIKKKSIKDIKVSLKKKNKKWEYGCEWYKNLTDTERERLVEYGKHY